jgi:iron complex transport system ATP-binding protein
MRPAVYGAGITVDLGGVRILDRVDLTVGTGDWVTIIGPNGAGKSTLLRALAGLLPAAGRIELFGADLGSMSRRERARCIAVVPQRAHLPEGMTVEHYVLLGRTPHVPALSAERGADLAVVAEAIATLELDDLAGRRLDTLSGGERQRAVLARALAQEPALLLLDEPTTALDIGHQQDVLELVDRLRRERGLTVVATMHDLTLAAQFGEHLVLVAGGRVVASGSPIQVLTGPDVARHYRATVDVIRHRGALVVVPLRASPTAPTTAPNQEDPTDAGT